MVNAGEGSHLNDNGEIETDSVLITNESSTNFSAVSSANCSIMYAYEIWKLIY